MLGSSVCRVKKGSASTSLVAQLVKNPPAIQETLVQFLGWEDLLEKGQSYPLQYSGLENSMDYYSPRGSRVG